MKKKATNPIVHDNIITIHRQRPALLIKLLKHKVEKMPAK